MVSNSQSESLYFLVPGLTWNVINWFRNNIFLFSSMLGWNPKQEMLKCRFCLDQPNWQNDVVQDKTKLCLFYCMLYKEIKNI